MYLNVFQNVAPICAVVLARCWFVARRLCSHPQPPPAASAVAEVSRVAMPGDGRNSLHTAVRRQFESASRPRPTMAAHVVPAPPLSSCDPCYRFAENGHCRRGAGCPFRHVGPSTVAVSAPRSSIRTGPGAGGVVRPAPLGSTSQSAHAAVGADIHAGGVKAAAVLTTLTPELTPRHNVAVDASEEVCSAGALMKAWAALPCRAPARPAQETGVPDEDDLQLCVDEYEYDELALGSALQAASAEQQSSEASALAEASARWQGLRVKQEV